MITVNRYELWNGKKVLGYYNTTSILMGSELIIHTISELKRIYGKYYEEIKIPLTCRIIRKDATEYSVRTVLDVRKKSKRQRELIKKAGA